MENGIEKKILISFIINTNECLERYGLFVNNELRKLVFIILKTINFINVVKGLTRI